MTSTPASSGGVGIMRVWRGGHDAPSVRTRFLQGSHKGPSREAGRVERTVACGARRVNAEGSLLLNRS
jgi:hypothetical protein